MVCNGMRVLVRNDMVENGGGWGEDIYPVKYCREVFYLGAVQES